MPALEQFTSVWKNLKEFELEPIRKEAMRPIRIALVGFPGSGRRMLAEQLLNDPRRGDQNLSDLVESGFESHLSSPVESLVQSPLLILEPDVSTHFDETDLVIILLNPERVDCSAELNLVRALGSEGKRVIVFCNSEDATQGQEILRKWAPWRASAVLVGRVDDPQGLLVGLVPAVLRLLPEKNLALGRLFPLFRAPLAQRIISDTCLANGAYALGSGLAEVVPVLNLPLNITDIVILTKAQAFLVYRLGLLLGFSTHWRDYLAEFGSVVGGGFLWRQLARSLVGLIPVWGIIPKVAVAYAGTYVVGHSVLQWYLTGRHLNARQVRDLYRQALSQGKENARKLLQRVPKPALPRLRRKRSQALPAPQEIPLPVPAQQLCSECGQFSAPDARFCQYCGHPFPEPQLPS